MKKIINWINKNKRLICYVFIIVTLIGIFMSLGGGVNADTNPVYSSEIGDAEKFIKYFIKNLLSVVGMGVLAKPIAALVNIVNVILFIIMYSIALAVGTTSGLRFPFPDQIVFNGIPMLDPNFINPTSDTTAVVNILSATVRKMYYSFFSLSGTVFVIAAAVIGIKLAFSTLASQKAQYKESIKHWITGIAMLFLMHVVLAGMFAINEQICISASKFCKDITFTVDSVQDVLVDGISQAVKGILGAVGDIFGVDDLGSITEVPVHGFGGLIFKFALRAFFKHDLIYAIGLSVILGQTFTLIIRYLKRVFYCIILGMIAPIVVAVDTIQKVVTGRDTGILKTWFQNMIALIFTQSFQAVFLCVVLLIINEMQNSISSADTTLDVLEALVTIVAINSLIKFDKLFKEVLGVKDSKILGGINDNAMKGFAAIKSGIALAQRSAEPFKKRAEAKSRIAEATKKRDKILEQISQNNTNNITTNTQSSQNTQNTQTNTVSNSNENTQNNNQNSNVQQNNSQSQSPASNEQLLTALNNLSNSLNSNTTAQQANTNAQQANTNAQQEKKNKRLYDELAKAEAEIKKARADQTAESLKAFTRFGTSIGALGFGLGATDNLGDAVTVGNLVDMPMDAITDRSVNRGVYGNTSRKVGSAQYREQLESKYRDSGMSTEQARAQAEKAVKSMQETLNKQIPETLAHMTKDITRDALGGVSDVLNREGRKFSKKVRKDMYESTRIDDI